MIDDINADHRVSPVPDVFEQVAAHMHQMLADIVWIEDADKVAYLAPLLALLQRQTRLVIANLHDALSHASFIGFTGTPVDLTDRSTRAVFGEYIDVYDVQRAIANGATVPICYESRLA